MINRDFEHLSELLAMFFGRREIQDKLNIIAEREITGWEVWLQIEFSSMLSSTEHEWWREQKLEYDYRQNKERLHFRPDFLLRKKGWTTGYYLALEFKQNNSATACVKNMIADIKKVGQMRKSQENLRSVWAVGITRQSDITRERLNELTDRYLDEKYYLTKRVNKHIQLVPIENTPYCYITV